MQRRWVLVTALVALLLGAAGVAAVTAELTRSVVHGWAETVGFGAGLLTAVAGVGAVLRLTSSLADDSKGPA